MRLTVRAGSAPAVERPGGSSTISIRSNSVLSIRAEATEGSTLEIVSNTNVSIQMLLFKPIVTRTEVTIAAENRLPIRTGTQMTITAAAADFGFNRDLVLAGQPDLANETLADFVLIGQRINDPTIPVRVTDPDGDDIKFTTQTGANLSHNLVSYNGDFGEVFYDLKVPILPVRSDFRHRMLYGNAGIEAPLSNPAATFSRAAAAWSWPSGQDFSGNARHLTLSTGTPSAFINVYAMAIDTANPANIIRPSFNATGENATNGLGSLTGKIVDWRGRVGAQHYFGANKNTNCTYLINSATSTTVFCGGRTKETESAYVNGTWKFVHGNDDYGENTPAIRVEQAPAGVKFQGFYFNGAMDAIIPAPSLPNNHHPIFENCCIINCRDDCIQNDGQRLGTYRNCYMQGHVWYSQRPGDAGTPSSGLVNTFEYCLIHMDRQLYDTDEGGTDNGVDGSKRSGKYLSPSQRNNTIVSGANIGWAHKWPIKSRKVGGDSSTVLLAKLVMRNCLIRIDTIPVEGLDNPGIFPTDGVYDNVVICWLGAPANGTGYGPWPFPQSKEQLAAIGITLIDDEQQAYNLWESTKAAWYSANGYESASDTFSWNRQESSPAFPYDRPSGEPSFTGATVVTATTEAQFRSAILNQAAGTSLEVRVSDISITQNLATNWGTNRTRRLKIVAVNKVFTAYDPMTDTKTNHQPNRAIIRRGLQLWGYDAVVYEGLEFRWGSCINNYRVNTVWAKHCDFISPPGEDGETMALSQVCDLYVIEQCRFESLDGTLGETAGGVSQDYAIRAYHETNVHFLGCRVTGLYHNPVSIKEDDTHSMFVRVDYCYFNGRDPDADYFDSNYCLLFGQTQDDSEKFDVTIPRADVKRCKFNCGNDQTGIQAWNVGTVNVTDCEFIRGEWGIEIKIDGQVYNPPRRVDPPIHPLLTYVKNCTWTNAPTSGHAIYLSTRSRGAAEVLRLENCSGPSGLLTIQKVNADQHIDRVGGNASGFAP